MGWRNMKSKKGQGSKKKGREKAFLEREARRKGKELKRTELDQAISTGDFPSAVKIMGQA